MTGNDTPGTLRPPTTRPLHQAPELLHRPGETEYTPELYAVLKRLRANPETPPHLIQEWYDLQSAHLRKVPLRERNTHALVLTPRSTLLGLELMVYPAGLGVMVISALVLFVGNVPPALCVVSSLIIGNLTMLLLNRFSTEAHRKAHTRLGMAPPPDNDNGLNV